jgi:hypothetical protein
MGLQRRPFFRLHGGPLEHTDSDVAHQKPSSSTVGHHFEVFCFDATTFRGHGSLDLAGTFFRSIAKHAVFITLYTVVTQPEASSSTVGHHFGAGPAASSSIIPK